MRIQDILSHYDISIRYNVPNIEPNSTHTILTRRTKNHIQLNMVECANYSNSDIELRFSPNNNILIPSKTNITINDRIVSQLEVKNLSSNNTIRSGEISFSFHRWLR